MGIMTTEPALNLAAAPKLPAQGTAGLPSKLSAAPIDTPQLAWQQLLSHLIASSLPPVQLPTTTEGIVDPPGPQAKTTQPSMKEAAAELPAVPLLGSAPDMGGTCGGIVEGAEQSTPHKESFDGPFHASIVPVNLHAVVEHEKTSQGGSKHLSTALREKTLTSPATPTASVLDPSAVASAAWIGTPVAVSLPMALPEVPAPLQPLPTEDMADPAAASSLSQARIPQIRAAAPMSASTLQPSDRAQAVEMLHINPNVNELMLPQCEASEVELETMAAPQARTAEIHPSRTQASAAILRSHSSASLQPVQGAVTNPKVAIDAPQMADPQNTRLDNLRPIDSSPVAIPPISIAPPVALHPQPARDPSIPTASNTPGAASTPDQSAQAARFIEPEIPITRPRMAASHNMSHDSVASFAHVEVNQVSPLVTSPVVTSPNSANIRLPEVAPAIAMTPNHTSDPFASLDTGSAVPAQWTSVGAHRAEAGFLDPALGWVGVRADAAGPSLHATVLPVTSEAAQVLATHLGGLQSYLAEHHAPAATISLADPGMSFTAHADSGSQQGSPQDAKTLPQPPIADLTAFAARTLSTTLSPTVFAAPAGATISVVA